MPDVQEGHLYPAESGRLKYQPVTRDGGRGGIRCACRSSTTTQDDTRQDASGRTLEPESLTIVEADMLQPMEGDGRERIIALHATQPRSPAATRYRCASGSAHLGCAWSSSKVGTNIRCTFFCPEIRAERRFQVIMRRCRLHQDGSESGGKGLKRGTTGADWASRHRDIGTSKVRKASVEGQTGQWQAAIGAGCCHRPLSWHVCPSRWPAGLGPVEPWGSGFLVDGVDVGCSQLAPDTPQEGKGAGG